MIIPFAQFINENSSDWSSQPPQPQTPQKIADVYKDLIVARAHSVGFQPHSIMHGLTKNVPIKEVSFSTAGGWYAHSNGRLEVPHFHCLDDLENYHISGRIRQGMDPAHHFTIKKIHRIQNLTSLAHELGHIAHFNAPPDEAIALNERIKQAAKSDLSRQPSAPELIIDLHTSDPHSTVAFTDMHHAANILAHGRDVSIGVNHGADYYKRFDNSQSGDKRIDSKFAAASEILANATGILATSNEKNPFHLKQNNLVTKHFPDVLKLVHDWHESQGVYKGVD